MSASAHNRQEQLIRHLRRKRSHVVQQQRRRRRALGGVAALAVALGSAMGVASFTGTDLAGAAVTRANNLMDLLDQRSPGERTEGQLTKTKVHHQSLADREEVPPAVQLAAALIAPAPAVLPVPVEVAASAPAQLPFLAPPPPPGAIFMSPPVGGGGGGGGGGGTPGGPPSTPPNSPPLIPPAVPEPSTWMTMLAGFAFMGWALRRQKAQIIGVLAS